MDEQNIKQLEWIGVYFLFSLVDG